MFKKRITIVVLDESKSHLRRLTSILAEIPEFLLVGKSTRLEQGLSVVSGKMPQMVFVNLELSDTSGFEMVRKLHARSLFPDVVFISGNSHSAYDALPFEPFDFLTKPVGKQDVLDMLERYKLKTRKKLLVTQINSLASNFTSDTKRTFKYKNGIVIFNLDEILICKSVRSRTILILKNGEEFKLSTSIKETIQTINHECFVKSSRSYWVNRDYLRKIDKRRSKCIIHNNDGKSWEIPVSRKFVQALEALITYPVS